MENARKPSSFFFFRKLIMLSPFYYAMKQLYSRYPIAATVTATTVYHKNTGMNLEIINTDRIMHRKPAYLLHVYLIPIPHLSDHR